MVFAELHDEALEFEGAARRANFSPEVAIRATSDGSVRTDRQRCVCGVTASQRLPPARSKCTRAGGFLSQL